MVMVGVDALEASPLNPRKLFDEGKLEELTESVRQHGVLQNLIVRRVLSSERYEIAAGERRWRAAVAAGVKSVPVRIVEDLDDAGLLELALHENLDRDDMDPIEEGEGLERLREMTGEAVERLVERFGKSAAWGAQRVRLTRLDEDGRAALRAGGMSVRTADLLLRVPEGQRGEALERLTAGDGLTEREGMALLKLRYVQPAMRGARWESMVREVEGSSSEHPVEGDCDWLFNNPGHVRCEDRPLPGDVTPAARARLESLPTWGDLAQVHEAPRRWVCDPDASDCVAVLVVEKVLLMDAERARCEGTREACIFPTTKREERHKSANEKRRQEGEEEAAARDAEKRRGELKEVLRGELWHWLLPAAEKALEFIATNWDFGRWLGEEEVAEWVDGMDQEECAGRVLAFLVMEVLDESNALGPPPEVVEALPIEARGRVKELLGLT